MSLFVRTIFFPELDVLGFLVNIEARGATFHVLFVACFKSRAAAKRFAADWRVALLRGIFGFFSLPCQRFQ